VGTAPFDVAAHASRAGRRGPPERGLHPGELDAHHRSADLAGVAVGHHDLAGEPALANGA